MECWGGADLVMAAVKDADQHQNQARKGFQVVQLKMMCPTTVL